MTRQVIDCTKGIYVNSTQAILFDGEKGEILYRSYMIHGLTGRSPYWRSHECTKNACAD